VPKRVIFVIQFWTFISRKKNMRNIWVVYQVKYYTNSMLMIYQKVNTGDGRECTTQTEAHLR